MCGEDDDLGEVLIQAANEEEEDDYQDPYVDSQLLPELSRWRDPYSGQVIYGIKVINVLQSTDCKLLDFYYCSLCRETFILKTHQMSCLPCGHMFGLSCLKKWMEGPSGMCPVCDEDYSLESIRLLYANRLCIPSAADQRETHKWFSFSKTGFSIFKKYVEYLVIDAEDNRSHVLDQRDLVGRRLRDALKRVAGLFNRMRDTEKRADVLEGQNDALKKKLSNRITDEEEWVEEASQLADGEKRVEVLRRIVQSLLQITLRYRLKADAFIQQAKALDGKAESLRQLVNSYKKSREFYKEEFYKYVLDEALIQQTTISPN